jgi:cytoskeleton protein RodZ
MTEEHGAEAPTPAATHDALTARAASSDAVAAIDSGSLPIDVFARRREELGLSLDDVANQLKFSARQIEALEAGDFDRLPGGAFARGMMRSYARLLKLEPADITDQLTAAGAKPQTALEEAVSLRTPIPFSEGGKHVNLVYMLLSVVILSVVAFFAIQWYQESSGIRKLAFVRPVTVVAPESGAPVQAPASSLAPEAATFASAGASPPAETTPVIEQRSVVRSTAPAAPSMVAGKGRITLRFDGQSWVEVKAARGAVLMSQLNPGGTEKVIEGDPPFELTIGNAMKVHLLYNDKPVDLKPHVNVDVARLTLN